MVILKKSKSMVILRKSMVTLRKSMVSLRKSMVILRGSLLLVDCLGCSYFMTPVQSMSLYSAFE